MRGRLLHLIGRLGVPLFEAVSSNTWRSLPRPPEGRAVARGPGHDPDRVLLIGGSSAVGWGVVSHDLALAGYLARGTAAMTERGVDIEVLGDTLISIDDVMAALTPSTVSRYDAIVLTLGSREGLQMMPADVWARRLRALLDHIADGREVAPSIIVVGAEKVEPVPLPLLITRIVRKRAREINAASQQIIADRPHVRYVDSAMLAAPGEPANLIEVDKPRLYERAARAIVPTLAALLESSHHRLPVPINEEARERAVTFVRTRLGQHDDRMDQLVETVMHVLNVRSADIFFVDRDEVHLIAATSEAPDRRRRADTLSSEAIEHRAGLVIPNLLADARHRLRPEVTGPPHLRFYASHPVESPDGDPIAVLTVVDTQPRELSASELALLRHFALRVGELLFEGYRTVT
jgi:hypothetical protein